MSVAAWKTAQAVEAAYAHAERREYDPHAATEIAMMLLGLPNERPAKVYPKTHTTAPRSEKEGE